MVRFLNLDFYSEIVEKPYLKRDFRTYSLGGGYGFLYALKRSRHSVNMCGRVCNVSSNVNMSRLLNHSVRAAINRNWEGITSFFLGLLIFCYKDIQDKLTFDPDYPQTRKTTKIRKCMDNLVFPEFAYNLLQELWHSDITFEEYLYALMDEPKLDFDLESALMVYTMQGDDAIFGILSQIYTMYDMKQTTNIQFIPDLPIVYVPPVSNFVSGVFFPVVVTKWSKYWYWEENEYGTYLIDEHGSVIDCAQSGNYCCASDPLFNRLGYVYHYGKISSPWRICWNWGEIVEAVEYFGDDVLVRGLGESIMRGDWRRFGVNGLLVVNCFKNRIAGDGYNLKKPHRAKFIKGVEIEGENNRVGVINLKGELIDTQPEGRVIYSNEEIEDWLELGELCQKALDK